MVKSVFQCTVVVLRIMAKEYSKLAHGILHSLFMGLLLLFIFKRTCYNYGRVNVLLAMSVMCALFSSILSTLSFIVLENNFNIWTIALILGWLLICSVMIFIMFRYHE